MKIGDIIIEHCPTCGRQKQVKLRQHGVKPRNCYSCANKLSHADNPRRGENHPCWKGYKRKDSNGYIVVYLPKEHRFFEMATNSGSRNAGGYVLEHRLVMAKYMKRPLSSGEIVHHKNGVKDDNRIENLDLTIREKHKNTYWAGYKEGYAQGCFDANMNNELQKHQAGLHKE